MAYLKLRLLTSLAVMKSYSKYMPVFAMPHSGIEYKPAPDKIKINLYHAMIDNGADAVFGGHPHWVQPSEVYKGHLIVYSMGNFIFDQQLGAEVTRSASIQVNVSLDSISNSDMLNKWLKLGETCATFHDDCLAQAQAQNLEKLDLKYNYKIINGDSSGKITKPGSAQQLVGILDRLSWSNTIKNLKPPYSAE